MGEQRAADEEREVGGAKPWEVVLTWGVILGLVGILLAVLGPQLINGGMGGTTALPIWALGLYSVVASAMIPFSAAFIGAAIVMRFLHPLAPIRRTGAVTGESLSHGDDGSPSD